MKIILYIIGIFLIFSFGRMYQTSQEKINIEHIVNSDEMENTPIELEIYINGKFYLYNTETNKTKVIY